MKSTFQREIRKEGNIEDFYIIEENEILGKGASAVVRKGIKIDTGEAYAIKIINKASLTQDEKESLDNELKIMGMVDHPNIVRVEEYYECNGLVFIVMELMEGGELFDRLVEVEHYTEKQAVEAFRPLVDAIRYCHSLGIVHRDLKPENLLYKTKDEDSLLKVSDFGFSKFLIPKAQEQLFTACGTPTYVAPEIIGNFGYDSKVDCWSLGVILYVMLCGYPPFYAEENNELFQLIKECDYEFHEPYWDNISEDAKDLIKKLLVSDPKKRLSAEEILKHPWITQNTYSSKPLQFKTDFIMKRKLRTAIGATWVVQMLQKQVKKNKAKNK